VDVEQRLIVPDYRSVPATEPAAAVPQWSSAIVRTVVLPCLLMAASVALWALSLPRIDPGRMSGLGLISVLPPTFFAALVVLAISFSRAVWQRQAVSSVLMLHVGLLVLFIHGTPAIVYKTVRYAWTYKHIGIVDYIQRHGSVDLTIPYLNVYHNWPGFFALDALFTDAAGLRSALAYAAWAPVFFDLLYVGGLALIYRALTDDRRLMWFAIWVFSLGNWVGEDYFSPQAFDYFFFLAIIGICLSGFGRAAPSNAWFRRWRATAWVTGWAGRFIPQTASPTYSELAIGRNRRIGLMTIAIVCLVVVVSVHQLTPFMVVSALTLLVVFGLVSMRDFTLLAIALVILWDVYAAQAYFLPNLHAIFANFGQLEGNFNAGLTRLSALPPSQGTVARITRLFTGIYILLPILGIIRRLRHGAWDVACILLIIAPFPAVYATRYGHEILFRIFLFSLPFTSFLLAALVYPTLASGRSRRTVVASSALSVALALGLCVANFGQETMNYFTPGEVAAVKYFYRVAPPGSLLIEGSYNDPIPFERYELYTYRTVSDLPSVGQRLAAVRSPVHTFLSWSKRFPNAYVLISNSERAEVSITGELPAAALDQIQAKLNASREFTPVFQNQDAIIFERTGTGGTG